MISRELTEKIISLAQSFPIVSVTGPRQAGKTTLIRNLFPEKPYVSLEEPDVRLLALDDPRAFLRQYENGAIFDEIQRVPDLFSYLQTRVDQSGNAGQFIISGSQSFLMHHKISQSLAGRVAILILLPFSLRELQQAQIKTDQLEQLIFTGFYPRIYDKQIDPQDFYPNYIQTYVERDVRSLKNIQQLDSFTRFLKLCAGRVGQLLNVSSLANDCGISVSTARGWLSVLQASYVVYLLQPHFRNFNKRLVKMPKLYFYDTGLACTLLGIERAEQLFHHYQRGELFENFVISELLKFQYNRGRQPNIYFWRDNKGVEIDCLVEKGERLIPIEIKSGMTPNPDFFSNLIKWNKFSNTGISNNFVIYAGEESLQLSKGWLLSWKELPSRVARLFT